jgi:hypothetical protein
MKKLMIGLTGICLVSLLVITKSLYVEGIELYIIIGAITVFTLSFNLRNKEKTLLKRLGISAIYGFSMCLVFGVLDMMMDHYMYFLPSGNEDGAPLSLGFKLEEYSDDLFVASAISMLVVIVVSLLFIKIVPNGKTNTIK